MQCSRGSSLRTIVWQSLTAASQMCPRVHSGVRPAVSKWRRPRRVCSPTRSLVNKRPLSGATARSRESSLQGNPIGKEKTEASHTARMGVASEPARPRIGPDHTAGFHNRECTAGFHERESELIFKNIVGYCLPSSTNDLSQCVFSLLLT